MTRVLGPRPPGGGRSREGIGRPTTAESTLPFRSLSSITPRRNRGTDPSTETGRAGLNYDGPRGSGVRRPDSVKVTRGPTVTDVGNETHFQIQNDQGLP